MPPAKKLTQAQKEILALYRKGLRMIKTKEQVRKLTVGSLPMWV